MIVNTYNQSDRSERVHTDYIIGKGGVALLWYKSLDKDVETIEIDSDRLVAIRLCLSSVSLVIIQVYLPSANHTVDAFKDVVDTLSDFCATHKAYSNIIVIDGFNASFGGSSNRRLMNSRDKYFRPSFMCRS